MRLPWATVRVFLLVAASAALASEDGDARLESEDAADAVLAAWRRPDAAGLRALAEAEDPDPWIVAEELCARGEVDAAAAFAAAGARPGLERLPAYVAGRRGKPRDAETRAVWRQAVLHDAAGRHEAAAAALEGIGEVGDGVLAALISQERATALEALGLFGPAGKAQAAAAEAAEGLGWLRLAAQAYQEAAALAYRAPDYRAALDWWNRSLGFHAARADRVAMAGVSGNLALAASRVGEWKQAIAFGEEAVLRWEPLGDPIQLLHAVRALGSLYAEAGDLGKALATLERALEVGEEVGLLAETAATREALAGVHTRRGDHPKAIELLQGALALAVEAGDDLRQASLLSGLAHAQALRGESAKALDLLARARALFVAAGDRAGVVGADLSTGAVLRDRGDFPAALSLLEEARRAAAQTGNLAEEARALGHLGRVHTLLGNYPRAYDLEIQARDAYERCGDRNSLAVVLSEIAEITRLRGDYPSALSHLARAQDLAEEVGDRGALARILHGVALVHLAVGDYARAAEIETLVRGIYQALGFQGAVAGAVQTLGAIRASQGDHALAVEEYRVALAIQDELGDRLGALASLLSLADAHRASGQAGKALPLLERVQALRGEMRDRVGIAATWLAFGDVYRSLGDSTSALDRYKKAGLEANSVGARELHVLALTGKALTLLDLGKPELALETAKQALPDMAMLAGGQGEEQGAGVQAQHAGLYEAGARAAVAVGDVEEAAFFLECGRAGTLLESLGGRRVLQAAALPSNLRDAEERARAAERTCFRAYLAALDGGDRGAIRAAREALEAARLAQKEVVERITRERKATADFVYPRPATVSRMQEWLRAGEAFVHYGLLATDAVALVVTGEGARLVTLAKTAEVQAACARLSIPADRADPAQAVAALQALVVGRLGLDARTTRILVSPDGALSYVPFSVLLPGREVIYEPSATTYGLLTEERDHRGEGVLALADPDYTVHAGTGAPAGRSDPGMALAVARGGVPLVPLPETREEARQVGDVLLLGTDATERRLRDALAARRRWHAVHFACHGLVDVERPTLSALALTADAEDDGFLTASDVLGMRIPADLAVLSACETMRGRVYEGEGVVGLARAFMLAGAPRVLVSLWKVDDEATRALMAKFYESWAPKDGRTALPAAEALRLAQDHVRSVERWKHPYYWAAWVLWGLPD